MLQDLLLQALWFILPAYFANATPVVAGRLFRNRFPMDFGLKFRGQPLLGAGKTWQGFFTALAAGTTVGVLQGRLLQGFLLSLGALLGDVAESFIKRRARIPRGKPLPLADQLDFLIGALLLVSVLEKPSLETVLVLLVITPAIHLGANLIARALKLKKEWY